MMKRKSMAAVPVLLSAWVLALPLRAQNGGVYLDPNRSDRLLRRAMIMNANQVETDITNHGTIARGNDSPIGGVWPRGTGHDHIHEMTGFIAAEVVDRNGQTIHIISDGYRDAGGSGGEIDPVTNISYKFHPLPGYFKVAPGQDELANSLNPSSWPETWPGKDQTWNGRWNGYFGLNQINADQEVLYVMDDSWNKEFQFYPFRDRPDWRGLGMQIETRLFQWAHPLAKDILFIHYQVSNIGEHTYNITDSKIFFGGYADIGPGGRGTTDDNAAFRKELNLVYGWDNDNIGVWQRNREIPPGYLGWKFLESPGLGDDGVDNDNDGLLDERRDNDAGNLIFGPVGKYGDAKEHWSGDEDGDWNPGVDDVGSDGAGPLDEGYPGPDADGTEGNGRPDQGEPNFGKTDNDESDQVGLTSFTAPLFGTVNVTDEEGMWPRIQPGYFTVPQQAVNQYWIFGSGPFNLPPRKTERFSTCWVFGADEVALFRSAEVAQRIYDSDYRFARPPRQPRLTAIPGNGRVTLIWDELAELSRDPIYGRDFEGYRLYRSTDPQFRDAREITDALGNALFRQPIAQFDLANGLTGPHPLQFGEEIGAPTGIHFYMGDDTGLQHYFIDEDVINGRTYYYALTAYDRGYDDDFYGRGLADSPFLFRITPSESPAAITVTDGVITRVDQNTAVVTPNPPASNLEPGRTDVGEVLHHSAGPATGTVGIRIVAPDLLKDENFRVSFGTVRGTTVVEYETSTVTVVNETTGDTLAARRAIPLNLGTAKYQREWTTEFLQKGFVLTFQNEFPTRELALSESGWEAGRRTNLVATVAPLFDTSPLWPVSFVLEFSDEVGVDTAFTSNTGRITRPVNFKVYDWHSRSPLDFVISEKVGQEDGKITAGEVAYLVFKPTPGATRYNPAWAVKFDPPLDENGLPLPESEWVLPRRGDTFVVRNRIPFSERDSFVFSTVAGRVRGNAPATVLGRVRVVPNPYVVASILEQQPYLSGRGERFVRFINLPAQCTIRIYTVNGDLVRVLQHNGVANGTERWDLTTKDGLEVAYGLYIYHLEAPGIGEHVGKFAIIN
ncbi:MAG: hypothetical protein ONB48_18790 [candidate division KSB1 bacterium]|nr:hypothetical protein [candidate division KSB1 bacterium]MDZ7276354.1 hypothetical protein [candidate division KSB1 bacterium]MDZ7287694.1 hypothetical protein [candidate division KSB1 bacterium]MDZ7299966.1 hypothetical protein [candidate division KSB1 bacterium]MDZ7305705.1 hypothetical protein [candidate division KSB1 bacterium]